VRVKTLAWTAVLAIRLIVDRNVDTAATEHFKFENVQSPVRDDAGATATIALIVGTLDANSASLTALNDGAFPTDEDQPGNNVFFKAGTWGGRIRFDFGNALDIAEIRSYSWHSDSRAAQLYKVFGSDESDSSFNAAPSNKLDPATCGWKLIAFVDTRPQPGDEGGQYAVRIVDSNGVIGHFRYLLFDVFETESDDPWGNSFYSEIDVIRK